MNHLRCSRFPQVNPKYHFNDAKCWSAGGWNKRNHRKTGFWKLCPNFLSDPKTEKTLVWTFQLTSFSGHFTPFRRDLCYELSRKLLLIWGYVFICLWAPENSTFYLSHPSLDFVLSCLSRIWVILTATIQETQSWNRTWRNCSTVSGFGFLWSK